MRRRTSRHWRVRNSRYSGEKRRRAERGGGRGALFPCPAIAPPSKPSLNGRCAGSQCKRPDMNHLGLAVVPQAVEEEVVKMDGHGPDAGLARTFASTLFAQIGDDALGVHSLDDLAKLALSAFTFFEERPGGEPKLRAYTFEHGSRGRVTIVEALND